MKYPPVIKRGVGEHMECTGWYLESNKTLKNLVESQESMVLQVITEQATMLLVAGANTCCICSAPW